MLCKLSMPQFLDMWVNLPFVHPDGMVFVVSMHIPNNEGVLIL